MGFGVFIHRSDSIYDDSPAEQYQFPRQYLRRVEARIGDWIVCYEPRKVADTRGYFAIARGERVVPNSTAFVLNARSGTTHPQSCVDLDKSLQNVRAANTLRSVTAYSASYGLHNRAIERNVQAIRVATTQA